MTKLTGMLALVVVTSCLGGCGAFDRWTAKWTGNAESCIDGVLYIQFASGASVKYLPSGQIATCP